MRLVDLNVEIVALTVPPVGVNCAECSRCICYRRLGGLNMCSAGIDLLLSCSSHGEHSHMSLGHIRRKVARFSAPWTLPKLGPWSRSRAAGPTSASRVRGRSFFSRLSFFFTFTLATVAELLLALAPHFAHQVPRGASAFSLSRLLFLSLPLRQSADE